VFAIPVFLTTRVVISFDSYFVHLLVLFSKLPSVRNQMNNKYSAYKLQKQSSANDLLQPDCMLD
jgi:hypothetical protein